MLCVLQQLAAELARQNDRPNLSFQGNLRPPALGGLHGDIPHLGHTDSGGTDGLQLKDRTIPLHEEVEQCLKHRFSTFAQRSPYVAISDRLRDAMHPVYLSRLARDAMDEEESLKNIRLVDLRHDFIIRQLETRPGPMWPGFPALL